jgi:two-component system, cell cycle response regulator DivK
MESASTTLNDPVLAASSPERRRDNTRDARGADRRAPARAPAPRPRARRAGLTPQRAHRVLVVDDSLDTREVYGTYLGHRGFGVATAPDGDAGIELALTHRPDVIVMDLAMPRLNGISALHRLRQDPRTRRIPVILLTGYAFRAIQQGALEVGADVFLTKPCLPEDLERHVRALLDRRRRPR